MPFTGSDQMATHMPTGTLVPRCNRSETEMMRTGSQWYLKFSAFAAAASKQPSTHETESPGAGQGAEVDVNDFSAGMLMHTTCLL